MNTIGTRQRSYFYSFRVFLAINVLLSGLEDISLQDLKTSELAFMPGDLPEVWSWERDVDG